MLKMMFRHAMCGEYLMRSQSFKEVSAPESMAKRIQELWEAAGRPSDLTGIFWFLSQGELWETDQDRDLATSSKHFEGEPSGASS